MNDQGFEYWLRQVDQKLTTICGMGVDDLPDCCYRDWYEDDYSPTDAARKAFRNADE